jgi:ubiquinone/menaquinone biosynthesis C-methylase UbiE
MLKRTLEPELMDTLEDARQYNRMELADVNRQFVDDLIAFASQCQLEGYDGLATDVVDLGTGTALIPIELCRRADSVHITAIDGAVNMLDVAVYNIEAATLRDRITLVKGDAKSLVHEDETFDTAISNSLIHHLPDPESCFAQMHRITATGGILFVRDLVRPPTDAVAQQLVQQYTQQSTEYCQRLFLESLHAALTIEEVKHIVTGLGYDHQTVTMSSDRHWTWAARKP